MKIIKILLALALAVSLLAVTACDKDTPSDTTEDTTVTGEEATTETHTEAPAAKVEVTMTVKDQDGNPMAEAVVTILPTAEEGESATLTADNEGKITVTLTEGDYTVRFDVLPEYVLGIDTALTVAAGMEPVVLEVIDNTPNGSVDRPFVIPDDTATVKIPAGETYHFTLFGAHNRTLTMNDPAAEVFYNNSTYKPDAEGKIAIRMKTESARDHSFFAVTNTSAEEREMTVVILSDPGAMDNPIVIETLGEAVTANVPQDGMVYYRWTATATGKLTVTSADTINNISLNNLANSKVTDFSNGAESVSLEVAEGDTITIVVSVIGGDKQAETNPVTFTLTLGE